MNAPAPVRAQRIRPRILGSMASALAIASESVCLRICAVAWLGMVTFHPRGGVAGPIPLGIQSSTNGIWLTVGPIAGPGALFVLAAPDLPTLATRPTIFFQTSSPITNQLRLPVPRTGGPAGQEYFSAAHWAGQAPAMADIPAGTFLMGTPPTESEQSAWEGPQTTVTLTTSFKMGRFEVTQAEYQALMETNPSYFPGVSDRPVEQVSWTNAVEYCARLTQAQSSSGCLPPGWRYRLPTEAEWEYACRAGTTTAFSEGPALRSGMANFNGHEEYDATFGSHFNPAGTAVDKTTPVGSYLPNAWGLFDMHGNLWEWCLDRWSYHLPGGYVTDPIGPVVGGDRVLRGGCWYNDARVCRSDYRGHGQTGYLGNDVGFRIVLVPPGP